jgi:hypothetical protein
VPRNTGMNEDATAHCCAECGKEQGGVSLKTCKSCMSVKYCNPECQKNHWAIHRKDCKLRAAELRDEALFKDPPVKEDCPICFLPMPVQLICCVSLPPATISSVPIYDFSIANVELASERMEQYYTCCGKTICGGCAYSFRQSGNESKCPFCNSDRGGKTDEDDVNELTKRADANDASAMTALGSWYLHGGRGLQQDHARAMELYAKAAELGYSNANYDMGVKYNQQGDMKKSKFHYEAAAMAGDEVARCIVGCLENDSGNIIRALKHWKIAASAGCFHAMHVLITCFEEGYVSRESINSTLKTYNNSCAEMRSEARDACIQFERAQFKL